MRAVILSISLLFSIQFNAQIQSTDSTLFDFWIGIWNLTWEDPSGGRGTGINQVEYILDGKVIQENFQGITGAYLGYDGKSWSIFDSSTQTWKQTWVDNQGAYLDFEALVDGEKRIFQREVVKDDKRSWQRMVFLDITEKSLIWEWQSSKDGLEWTTNWKIHYIRRE